MSIENREKDKKKNDIGLEGTSIRNQKINPRLRGKNPRSNTINIGMGYGDVEVIEAGIENKFTATRLSDGKKIVMKGDYAEPFLGFVTVSPSRALKTNRIQKLPKLLQWPGALIFSLVRLRPFMTQSKNMLMEVLANNIAKHSGMLCQEQSVEITTYRNGDLKILAEGEWQKGLKSLGEVKGGSYSKGNYLVSKGHGEGLAVADDSVKNMGQEWAMMVMMGDVDGLGSRLQNKQRLGNRFFGFDFGQAFRGKNTAVSHLSDNGMFAGKGNPYKNYSIFDDGPLSEKMAGVHYMRKLFLGVEPNDRVKDSFGKEFKERLDAIKPGDGMKIFDDYIKKFEDLRKEARTPKQWAQLKSLVKEIESAKKIAETSANTLNRAFGARVGYTKEEIDIVENLEKLTSETSLRSGDKSVLLNHIKVEKRVAWDKVVSPEGKVGFKTRDPEDSVRVAEHLDKLSGLNQGFHAYDGDDILIKCDASRLHELHQVLSEDKIKEVNHGKDLEIYNNIKNKGGVSASVTKEVSATQTKQKTQSPLSRLMRGMKIKSQKRQKAEVTQQSKTRSTKRRRPNLRVAVEHVKKQAKKKAGKAQSWVKDKRKVDTSTQQQEETKQKTPSSPSPSSK